MREKLLRQLDILALQLEHIAVQINNREAVKHIYKAVSHIKTALAILDGVKTVNQPELEKIVHLVNKKYSEIYDKAIEVFEELYYPSWYGYNSEEDKIQLYREATNDVVLVINGRKAVYQAYPYPQIYTDHETLKLIYDNADKLINLGKALTKFINEINTVERMLKDIARKMPEYLDIALETVEKIFSEPKYLD